MWSIGLPHPQTRDLVTSGDWTSLGAFFSSNMDGGVVAIRFEKWMGSLNSQRMFSQTLVET